MSTTSHQPSASHPGGEPPKVESQGTGVPVRDAAAGAIALLVVGLPLALLATTLVTLWVLDWSPTYQTALKLTTSVIVLVVTGLAFWIGFRLEKRSRGAGSLVQAVSVFAAVTALPLVLVGSAGSVGVAAPVVVNASSQTVVVLSGPQGALHRWRTLAPGEQAVGDGPFLSTSGCYPNMGLEARTTDGRVIGTLDRFCASEIWRITDTGAEKNQVDR